MARGLNQLPIFIRGIYKIWWMSHVSTERTTAPSSAAKNPEIMNPGTIAETSQKRSALRMNEKRPKVMMVMGSVRMVSIGFITVMTTDHTSATRRIVTHPPETEIPGTMETVRYTAATVPK